MSEPPDLWQRLRGLTRARIGLARSGDGLPTSAVLALQLAHAHARDAVHGRVDFAALAAAVAAPSIAVHSAAADRAAYIRRPDLGRRLDDASRDRLTAQGGGPWDVVFIIGDGLSAAAVGDHALPVLRACLRRLPGWRVAPVILAEQARVALSDEIGALLRATLAVMLIGERPGLSVANSLGIYLTWQPRPGRSDAERNCISNIHADGLSHDAAADILTWLLGEARRRRLSGVALKDERRPALIATTDGTGE